MILVDRRAGSGDMVTDLKARMNGQSQLADLPGGDFAFDGNGPDGPVCIGIERKALGDMLGSMRTNRLTGRQLPVMNKMYDVVYVLVEGQYRANAEGTLEGLQWDRTDRKVRWRPYTLAAKGPQSKQYFRYAELDKHIVTLETKKNVAVIYTYDKTTSVWAVINRYNWWQKEWDEHTSADPIKMQQDVFFGRTTLCEEYASKLLGMGQKRARQIAKHFKTVECMVNGVPAEWTEIEFVNKNGGISHMSRKTAEACYAAFRTDR